MEEVWDNVLSSGHERIQEPSLPGGKQAKQHSKMAGGGTRHPPPQADQWLMLTAAGGGRVGSLDGGDSW